MLRQVTDEMPVPIHSFNRDVPDWLVAIIDRLLAKDPKDRIQTAAEVANLLFEGEARLLFCPIHGVKAKSGLARVTRPAKTQTSMLIPTMTLCAGLLLGLAMAAFGWAPSWSAGPKAHPPLPSQRPSMSTWGIPARSGRLAIPQTATRWRWRSRTAPCACGMSQGSRTRLLPGHKGAVWPWTSTRRHSRATAGEDGKVGLWSLPTASTLVTGDRSSARSVQFTPDGRGVLVATRDGTVAIFDAITLERRVTTMGHQVVHAQP